MVKISHFTLFLAFIALVPYTLAVSDDFVTVEGRNFYLDGKKYFFLGTNYWYGMNLGAPESGNRTRLQQELDDLVSIGVKNLRIMGSTQGPDTKRRRIVPTLEYDKEQYNDDIWEGLDIFLYEMGKRNMKAVVTLNNFWEWSGGFGQINEWYTGSFSRYPTNFYGQKNQTDHLNRFINLIINRRNTVTGVKYKDDPAIMAWQLANEPRAGSCSIWADWVNKTSAYIKSLDSNHLVSIGNEGSITACSSSGNPLPNIDYITFHAWAQNWGWFSPYTNNPARFESGKNRAHGYITSNVGASKNLNKPIVLEEFGLARDNVNYNPTSETTIKDQYYEFMFETVLSLAKQDDSMSGINFWAYGGQGRPRNNGGEYWKAGDDFTGDPPHEKQGWYSVYDTDTSTKDVISNFTAQFDALCE